MARDYDHDGAIDLAVYRPSNGTWYIRNVAVIGWGGASDDIPVPGDYDGDGIIDIAVYRPSAGTWYIRNGAVIGWGGASGDVPV